MTLEILDIVLKVEDLTFMSVTKDSFQGDLVSTLVSLLDFYENNYNTIYIYIYKYTCIYFLKMVLFSKFLINIS